MDVTKKLLGIFEDYRIYLDTPVMDINLDTEIRDFVFDSLDMVELIMKIEAEFGITIQDDYAEDISRDLTLTIGDIKNELRDKFGIFDIREERRKKINNLDNG